jgi:hypothetical protein
MGNCLRIAGFPLHDFYDTPFILFPFTFVPWLSLGDGPGSFFVYYCYSAGRRTSAFPLHVLIALLITANAVSLLTMFGGYYILLLLPYSGKEDYYVKDRNSGNSQKD